MSGRTTCGESAAHGRLRRRLHDRRGLRWQRGAHRRRCRWRRLDALAEHGAGREHREDHEGPPDGSPPRSTGRRLRPRDVREGHRWRDLRRSELRRRDVRGGHRWRDLRRSELRRRGDGYRRGRGCPRCRRRPSDRRGSGPRGQVQRHAEVTLVGPAATLLPAPAASDRRRARDRAPVGLHQAHDQGLPRDVGASRQVPDLLAAKLDPHRLPGRAVRVLRLGDEVRHDVVSVAVARLRTDDTLDRVLIVRLPDDLLLSDARKPGTPSTSRSSGSAELTVDAASRAAAGPRRPRPACRSCPCR